LNFDFSLGLAVDLIAWINDVVQMPKVIQGLSYDFGRAFLLLHFQDFQNSTSSHVTYSHQLLIFGSA
jgi:hypothetical protein